MPYIPPPNWSLTYEDPRSNARTLISMPAEMLRDLRVLSKSQGLSVAEMIRRAVTREIAAVLEERPEIRASFRGKLPM